MLQKRQVVTLPRFRKEQLVHSQLRLNCVFLLTINLGFSHETHALRDFELNVAHCKHNQYTWLHKRRDVLFKLALRNEDSDKGVPTVLLDPSKVLVDKLCAAEDLPFFGNGAPCGRRKFYMLMTCIILIIIGTRLSECTKYTYLH